MWCAMGCGACEGRAVDEARGSGQVKGELLKGRKLGQRFAWQRDPSSSAPL